MIIAIVNQKGGTGKTTTTVNLGCALAKKGKKVLLVDLDAQGNLSYSLGLTEFENTMAEVLVGEAELNDILLESENVHVAPSNIGLADVELSIASVENRESLLKNQLDQLNEYDYVLIDCPPSLSLLTINALNAADRVIIPLQMEVLSLQGLDLIIDTVTKIKNVFNEDLMIEGLLPVMVDRRRKLSTEVYDHIEQNYDFKIFDSSIRTNVRASEAPSFGSSVISYAPDSNSAKDYLKFADEMISLNDK